MADKLVVEGELVEHQGYDYVAFTVGDEWLSELIEGALESYKDSYGRVRITIERLTERE